MDAASLAVRHELEGHVADLYLARIFPSGKVLLTGGADRSMRIWSLEEGYCAATLTGPHKGALLGAAFVERGRHFLGPHPTPLPLLRRAAA